MPWLKCWEWFEGCIANVKLGVLATESIGHFHSGLDARSSEVCFAPSTDILPKYGYRRIARSGKKRTTVGLMPATTSLLPVNRRRRAVTFYPRRF